MSIFSRVFSGGSDPLATHAKELAQINNYKDEVTGLTQEQMRAEIQNFRDGLAKLDDNEKLFKKLTEIRPRVFALTREAAKRAIKQFHYDVQIVGGIILADGAIAEMKTGEGKTLTATL